MSVVEKEQMTCCNFSPITTRNRLPRHHVVEGEYKYFPLYYMKFDEMINH